MKFINAMVWFWFSIIFLSSTLMAMHNSIGVPSYETLDSELQSAVPDTSGKIGIAFSAFASEKAISIFQANDNFGTYTPRIGRYLKTALELAHNKEFEYLFIPNFGRLSEKLYPVLKNEIDEFYKNHVTSSLKVCLLVKKGETKLYNEFAKAHAKFVSEYHFYNEKMYDYFRGGQIRERDIANFSPLTAFSEALGKEEALQLANLPKVKHHIDGIAISNLGLAGSSDIVEMVVRLSQNDNDTYVVPFNHLQTLMLRIGYPAMVENKTAGLYLIIQNSCLQTSCQQYKAFHAFITGQPVKEIDEEWHFGADRCANSEFKIPVTLPSGFSFERDVIIPWGQAGYSDPLTGDNFDVNTLKENALLKNAIELSIARVDKEPTWDNCKHEVNSFFAITENHPVIYNDVSLKKYLADLKDYVDRTSNNAEALDYDIVRERINAIINNEMAAEDSNANYNMCTEVNERFGF
jgi:hypothetical protein